MRNHSKGSLWGASNWDGKFVPERVFRQKKNTLIGPITNRSFLSGQSETKNLALSFRDWVFSCAVVMLELRSHARVV